MTAHPMVACTSRSWRPSSATKWAQASIALYRAYDRMVERTSNLHRIEYTLLMLVRANPGCTSYALAKALAVSAPNMALWLERVTGKGLVKRIPSASDRRTNHLKLTSRGEDMARRTTDVLAAAEDTALAHLTRAERAMLTELLHKVARVRDATHAEREADLPASPTRARRRLRHAGVRCGSACVSMLQSPWNR